MRKGIYILLPVILFSAITRGNDGDYAVSKIPDSLKKNANAVIRLEETSIEVKSLKYYKINYHYVITILNENGEKWAKFEDNYDKLKSINSVEGNLYDANGKELKKMKWKDLMDLSGTEDISLADDNRLKVHSFFYKVYPYTIEYYEESEYNTTFSFPIWVAQDGEKLSVEKSTMQFSCPAEYKFRYRTFNYKGDPVITTDKDNKVYAWTVASLPALIKESYGPMLYEMTPTILIAPNDFEMGNYRGDMSTWQGYGQFQNQLNEGRDILPENIKQAVHSLTDGVTDLRKKISLLYEMLQKNTRYISIQLGIGGWQPFDATYVAGKGYGDCKALSNYMHALLKEAGINSCYTVVRAGENDKYITSDFPSNQFNHVILCVPLQKDTVWLECTSQFVPAGYLGNFTEDRYCVVVNEKGGNLVRTPKYNYKDNLQLRKVSATLDADDGLAIKSVTDYYNLQQDPYFMLIHALSKDKVKEFLNDILDLPTYEIGNFDYKEEKSAHPVIHESLDIYASNYATVTGRRLFIIPNVMGRTHRKISAEEERKYDVVLENEYTDIDSVEIEIPPGYTVESMPQPVSILTKFGKYQNDIKFAGNKISYNRHVENYSGRFPPAAYADLVKYYDAVYKADRNKIVLVKNE